MNAFLTIALMAVIGAIIGGMTNHLAIKMLFRPHEAKYIGNWRVPFTPGLIPKRRDELARQFGRIVVDYLLTPETFRNKLFTPAVREKAEGVIGRLIGKHVFGGDKTLSDWLDMAGMRDADTKIEAAALRLVDGQFEEAKKRLLTGTVAEQVPARWMEEAEEKLPEIRRYILSRAMEYVNSFEGRQTIRKMLDDFLESRGTFGGMLQSLFGNSETLVDKIQREGLKFLSASGTARLLDGLIEGEFEKLKNRPVEELIGGFDWEGLKTSVLGYVRKELAAGERLDRTLKDYWPEGEAWVAHNVTPALTDFAFSQAEAKMEEALGRLKIDQMVKEQVDSFPVSRLEDLVLGISRREFKMITVLGAVLGGLIGIIQGLIVFLIN
ncbi:DUF445 domain-containing protein [Bhargavaea beijingensis]|uniref:DUF445 family protein n=1 Tax=Bhargavaea beijingensis TaxID=426756 RepID=A0A1G7DZP7_9BACL|nr:DUF445 family protein [Bhargavaea beijingensis]RSK25053.1 DUF445 family protein [Bhargavaea beijingensis]SDE56948.1 Uncharacterized membrane protein YheB, UPF0754 family [Bhargavaea beijingensis]